MDVKFLITCTDPEEDEFTTEAETQDEAEMLMAQLADQGYTNIRLERIRI